jgi:hypothetical protein
MSDCNPVPLLPRQPEPQRDSLQVFALAFRALPDELGRAPAIRVRQLLRYALRQCRLKNLGFVDGLPAAQDGSRGEPAGPGGSQAVGAEGGG